MEGVDISREMLDVCQKKAEKLGLHPTVYCQSMQELDIPRRYGCIFIPFGSFMLVERSFHARQVLRKFYHHLTDDGVLAIPLFDPTKTDIAVDAPVSGQWRLRRRQRRGGGADVECWERSIFDMENKIQNIEYLLKVINNEKVLKEKVEKDTLYWYSQSEFASMLHEAGFSHVECLRGYSDQAASENDEEYTFLAKKA